MIIGFPSFTAESTVAIVTIGFNIDPLFNYCLDALMIMDIKNAPKNLMDSLSKDLNDAGKLEKLLSENQT